MDKPTRVLLVDDNADLRLLAARLLRSEGYDVLEASTGAIGLQLAREQRPDLILLDVNLPDISGIEVCRRIKADPSLAQTFVVHISAVEISSESQVSGLQAGADGYIALPVKYPELLARIQAMIRIMKAEKAVRESEELWRTVFATSNDLLLLLDDQHGIRACNEKAAQAYGYSAQEMLGMKMQALCAPEMRAAFEQRLAEAAAKKGLTFEAAQLRKSGTAFPAEVSCKCFTVGDQRQFLLALRDITERKQTEERLLYHITHDTLTDLYSRAFFEEEMGRFQRGRQFPVSLVMADLDGLKEVNDTQGHAAGDDLLRRAACVLKNSFRADDIIARIGGDEFAVILPNADAATAQKAIARVKGWLFQHNQSYPRGPELRFSIGTATAAAGDSLTAVLKRAEDQMYAQKLALPGRMRR